MCTSAMQSYIRVGDLQSLSYAAGEDAKIAGGDTVEQLEVWCPGLLYAGGLLPQRVAT